VPVVFPFRALRPPAELAASVASVPYDVVNRAEARALAVGNPSSFLHVTKPEIDLPEEVDVHDQRVYAGGRAALEQMSAEGLLVRDQAPGFYVYRATMAEHTQTGFALCASVADYERNLVRKHEHTRPDKEEDRVHHMEAARAQTGTVFLTHPDSDALAAEIERATVAAPAIDIEAGDGVRHQLWVIDEPDRVRSIADGFAALDAIYIADGHHRSAAAARVAAAHRPTAADAPTEMFLAVSFPQSQVQILGYNRVVRDLNGSSVANFMGSVRERFEVGDGKPEPAPRRFGMYLDGAWYTLDAREGSYDATDPVARLDVAILQDVLLERVLGIDDPRTNPRIDFVGGIRGDGELERRVAEGWAVAFSLYPTAIEDVIAVADAGQVMPPKSTWFEPKLRDGLVVHIFD
jgi:uncharacterized protein (DUF1015 family)